MTAITNLSEDDRDLIRWYVREFCDTYELYNPEADRSDVMRLCFVDIRLWTKWWDLRAALAELGRQRERIPETFYREQSRAAQELESDRRAWAGSR